MIEQSEVQSLHIKFGVGTRIKRVLVVYVYVVVLSVAPCTSVYKRAPKQTYFSCLCLWGGAFSHILYFGVQTGTNTNLDLVVYVYRVVLFLASCTSMYKQAPKQTYLKLFMFMGWCFYSLLVLWCTNRHQNRPILSCLSL